MSQTPVVPPSAPTPPPPPQRRGNGVGGCLRSLLLILVSAALGIIGAAALAFYLFGYRPETPAQAGQVAQLQEQLSTLGEQNASMQTRVAELTRNGTGATEQIQDLDQQLRDLRSEVENVSALGDQMREYANVAATVQLEARDSRTAVAFNASVQATRFAQLDELNRRTDRLGRFLDRLSDIAGDTASDLDASGSSDLDLTRTPTITETTLTLTVVPTTSAVPPSFTALPATASVVPATASPTAAVTRTAITATRSTIPATRTTTPTVTP